jgi:hypothetical protein
MDIQINGACIVLDANTDDIKEYAHLMCICGHELMRHASWIQWYYPDPYHHTAHQSQCTACGNDIKLDTFECPRFRMETVNEN